MAPSARPVVIITGSSGGMGHDLAERLHTRGYNVVISGRRATVEGVPIAAKLDTTGETAIYVSCDVASYASQSALFRAAWEKWGRLDALVANAGIIDKGSRYNLMRTAAGVEDVPPEPDLGCTDADFKGVVYGTELAVHYMRHNPFEHAGVEKGGRIVLTGSIVAIYPWSMAPEYASAKAAVLQWGRAMAPMLALEGITINTVLPNAYETDIMPGFREAFLDEHLTQKECLMSAFDIFLEDKDKARTGQAVETAYDKHFFHEVPAYKSGKVIERTCKVYEPWFEMMHGSRSGLTNTYQEPLRKILE